MTTPEWPQAIIPPFPAGYAPHPPAMNGWVQQNFGFCSQMPLFRAMQQASQSIPANTWTPLSFGGTAGDILEDPYTGWSHTAIPGQPANSYLVPFTGWYEVLVTVITAAQAMFLAAGAIISGGIPEDGEHVQVPAASARGGASASLLVPATGGIDYLQPAAFATVAATTTAGTIGQIPAVEISYWSSG